MHPSQGSRYATKDPLFANGASMVFSASTRSAESVVVFAGFLAAIVLLQVLSDACAAV